MVLNFSGLSDSEVHQREIDGLTYKYVSTKAKTVPEILYENSVSVFNIVNIIIISILIFFYFYKNDSRLILDSLGITCVMLFNTIMAIYQEIKSNRILSNLELLKERKVKVVRNGRIVEINRWEIVKDETIFIEKGEQVAVDGSVLQSNHLEIDESLLTGEAIAQYKKQGDFILSGSFCVYGNGFYLAEESCENLYAMKILSEAKRYKIFSSPLLKKINLLFISFFIISILMVIIESFFVLKSNIFNIEDVRRISAIGLSLIPEGLIFFSTFTFAVGIYRIAKIGALVQRINAIDSFTAIDVVCMDKTGTLTKNKISVDNISYIKDSKLYSGIKIESLIGTFARITSEQNPSAQALYKYPPLDNYEIIDELPFRSETKMSLFKIKFNSKYFIMILGSYESLFNKVPESYKGLIKTLYEKNNCHLYRNLLFGMLRYLPPGKFCPDIYDKIIIDPLCIISLKDELREDAKYALKHFKNNNVKINILSGDSENSVRTVLKDLEMKIESEEIIDGEDIDLMDNKILSSSVIKKSVFVRLKPEHKLRIVKALKHHGKRIAFIGDGINDLPAIKESDLGIAMGSGSGITKEISDIVLLNDEFTILPKIFGEGNKIINTIRYVSRLLVTKNFVIILLSIFSMIGISIFPLTPRISSLVSLFSIGFPSYVIALYNTNTSKSSGFFKDIFAFSFFSSLIISFSVLLGYIQVSEQNFLGYEINNVLVGIIILLTLSNFCAAVNIENKKNNARFIFYCFIFFIIYVLLVAFEHNNIFFIIITSFYEITKYSPVVWKNIIKFTLIPGIILYLIHYYIYRTKLKHSKIKIRKLNFED
jgi:cation-transporting ATPase E